LLVNQTPSIIEPVFPEVIELLKEYLSPYILSVQYQQILGSLLYHAILISRDTINTIQKLDCDIGFLEDYLDRPQTTLHYLIDGIQLSDILEI
ncbi:15405_t:CDS:2, partial [Gigaspora rosea]